MLISDSGKLLAMLQRICDSAIDNSGAASVNAEVPLKIIEDARLLLAEVNKRIRA